MNIYVHAQSDSLFFFRDNNTLKEVVVPALFLQEQMKQAGILQPYSNSKCVHQAHLI
jgi:hypothetical protein